ncbi:MAG: polysaccharide deacetylase family protein [Agriterribacter sp.]
MKDCMYILKAFLLLSFLSCKSSPEPSKDVKDSVDTTHAGVKLTPAASSSDTTIANASTIASRLQVPVLCYHQIREWRAHESRLVKDVVVPPALFRAQLQILADSGYHTILPDDLYSYLTKGTALPSKPIMLTYDDGDVDQYNIALPEMEKHGFKGVYFVMTVSLGRSIYMNKAQIKELSDKGNVIASHTWDHHDVRKYKGDDWVKQIEQSSKQLEDITGKPITYFAYPFGLWNKEAFPELKKRHIVAAFQLSTKMDEQDPLYTIRRMIVPGDWSPTTMLKAMKQTFKI